VDAVTKAFVLLWRILFYRPLIVVMLLVVYSVAALLLVTVDSPKKGLAVMSLAAFATLGLSAVLTERISRHALQARAIGLPNHAQIMRRVQVCFLVMFVAAPAALADILGANPLAALAGLVIATAAGVALATFGGVWIVLLPFLGRVLPLGEWAGLPPVQALVTGLGGFVIWRWFELPAKMERVSTPASVRLADATHERLERARPAEDSSREDEQSRIPPEELLAGEAAVDLNSGRRLSAVLALGFGYSVGIRWRALSYGAGISIAFMAALNLLYGSRHAVAAYTLVTGACCVAVVGQLQGLLQRWMRTSAEQALLQLAPKWPDARQIKRAVIETTIVVQHGGIAVWIASSTTAALAGWIGSMELFCGGVAILGTSLAFSGAAWAVLSYRRIREWQFSTIALVLIVCAGAVTVVFGTPVATRSGIVGLAMMLIPPALALAAYCLAPLRFPLNVDARVLKVTQ
jgi:hypothetical protein